jgi:ATP synthase protein I
MVARTRPLRPLLIVFGAQTAVTIMLAVISGWSAGVPGAISAVLGGAVALAGGLAFALFMPRKTCPTAFDILSRMLRAEAAKVGVIVLLLWLVLTAYKEIVMVGFIGTFTIAVIVFSLAVFIRNPVLLETGKNNVD